MAEVDGAVAAAMACLKGKGGWVGELVSVGRAGDRANLERDLDNDRLWTRVELCRRRRIEGCKGQCRTLGSSENGQDRRVRPRGG